MLVVLFGALFVLAGVIYLGVSAIWKGPLSRRPRTREGATTESLEPPGRGITVFGLASNWPGLVLIGAGGALLLAGVLA